MIMAIMPDPAAVFNGWPGWLPIALFGVILVAAST